MDQVKEFNQKLKKSEVEYGLITISKYYRDYFPSPGESLTVHDEKNRKYPTKMHSKQSRIDGLTLWYRNHPSVKQGDTITVVIESQNIIKLTPDDSNTHTIQKPKSIDELFDCIQSTLISVNKSINQSTMNKNYEKAELYSKLGKELLEFQSRLSDIKKKLEIGSSLR